MAGDAFRRNPFVGFGCGGYRSFSGPEPARIGPFDRVQVIAGQNNCGKSALIDYLIKVVGAISEHDVIRKEDNPLTQEDYPLKGIDLQCSPTISFCVDIEALKEKLEASTRDPFRQSYASDFAKLFRGTPYATKDASSAWIDFKLERGKVVRGYNGTLNPLYSQYETAGGTINLSDASLKICSNAGDNQLNYANVIRAAMPWESLPSFLKVGAIRSIEDSDASGNKGDVSSGLGLPSALLRLYNPERKDFEESKQRWNKLQGFVRDVLNDPGASILVSHDSHEIAVKTSDTDYLPLESLGTGVTELLILAAVVACNSSKIICIEEPEIHLHPALQARFMNYLLTDESNRFIVTTHSPAIINTNGVQVAHVSKANGVSECRQLDEIATARDLLDDLGARASDLLQSNYVVWVEGPSDRIYVNHWIGE